jgi:acetolactate synthase small subunit
LKSAMTNINITEQKESDVKARKITNKLVVKIFNATGEDLESLMSLKPEELISRYEQVTNSDKVEEISENLADLKNKLNLQNIQKEAYERQHLDIIKVLNIPEENRCFANILPSVIALKECLNKIQEQNEIEHYSHAQGVIESYQG